MTDLKELEDVMKTAHDNENSFNRALFAALRTCLDRQQVIDKCDDPKEYIVFKYGKIDGYAFGIAREAFGEQNDNERHLDKNDTINSDLPAGLGLDHCCCLLKMEKRRKWRVANCLSAVKLQMNNSSHCAAFENEKKVSASLRLGDDHGALAQVRQMRACTFKRNDAHPNRRH
jgi:hypothetical protein